MTCLVFVMVGLLTTDVHPERGKTTGQYEYVPEKHCHTDDGGTPVRTSVAGVSVP